MGEYTKNRYLIIFICLLAIILSGCQSSIPTIQADQEEATSSTTAPDQPAVISGASGSFFSIDEIGLGSDGYVALTNFTDVSVSTGGLILCQGSTCFELPDVVVGAGETVRIAVGDGAGHEGVVATRATLGELRPFDGEIALVVSQELDDPKAMLVYFQWGSNPHDLTQIAVDAGLWVEGGFGPSSQNAIRLFRVEESGLWLFEE